mgnify:CR=1 FL=1
MLKVKNYIQATGNFIKVESGEEAELEVVSGKFKGCKFYYSGMKFADEENEDGSINMSFERDITNDFKVSDEDAQEFNTFLGDNLILILEEMLEKNTAVFKGGV